MKWNPMKSDHLEYMMLKPTNSYEQNRNNEMGECAEEDVLMASSPVFVGKDKQSGDTKNKMDKRKSVKFQMAENVPSAKNVSNEPNFASIIDNEDNEPEMQVHINEAGKETFLMPEHFLAQTLTTSYSNDAMDAKCVVPAESLVTRTHTHDKGKKRVRYLCNICKKDFKDRTDCIRHVRIHTGEKPFKCYICGESFGRECYLSKHMRTHTGEKPFTCPLCHRDFARKAALDQHFLTHTDMSLRPFPCNQCEKGFTTRSHLDRHLKTHSQIRDFKCSMCEKDFLDNRALNDHIMRKHSEEVDVSCELCGKKFKFEHRLQRHMKIHHKPDSDESSTDEEDVLKVSFPIFVSKDKKIIQNKPQNPSFANI